MGVARRGVGAPSSRAPFAELTEPFRIEPVCAVGSGPARAACAGRSRCCAPVGSHGRAAGSGRVLPWGTCRGPPALGQPRALPTVITGTSEGSRFLARGGHSPWATGTAARGLSAPRVSYVPWLTPVPARRCLCHQQLFKGKLPPQPLHSFPLWPPALLSADGVRQVKPGSSEPWSSLLLLAPPAPVGCCCCSRLGPVGPQRLRMGSVPLWASSAQAGAAAALSGAPQVAGELRVVDADSGSLLAGGKPPPSCLPQLPAPPWATCRHRGEAGGAAATSGPPHSGVGQPRSTAEPQAELSTVQGPDELRLVGGGGRCAGRVEVKHEGEWGSVCTYDFDWDAHWATVVCRQLGCGTAATSSPYAPFGQGTGRIWLHVFFCRGDEAMLQDCPHFGWGQHFCGHERDVGVTCTDALELRLAGGSGPCDGKVELKLRGRWGSVADDTWDMMDAEVVCQQLGCGSATRAYMKGSKYSSGDPPVNMVLVNCRGHEKALWECEVRGWGPYDGFHDYDTAVVCQGFSRLVGGDGPCAGRLEVRQGRAWAGLCEDAVELKAAQVVCRELGCGSVLAVPGAGLFPAASEPQWDAGFECSGSELLLSACRQRARSAQACSGHASIVCSSYSGFRLANHSSRCAGRVEVMAGGTWGSLCASAWDLPDAHVLCHHLGCGPASAVLPGGSFGSGNGTLRVDAFGCSGSEQHPGQCPVAVLGEPSCPPGHAAAVECSGAAEPLRLLEGQSRCEGRLEVPTSPGSWAAVSAGLRAPQAATVACRELGCGELERVYPVAGPGGVGLQEVQCAGSEDALAQCNVSGRASAGSGAGEALALVCSGSRRLRLAGGPGRCAGRVELYVEGAWSPVCQDAWDIPDAAVVCRQLGCGAALDAPGSARFGPGAAPPWAGAGGCAGSEASLWDCPAPAQRGCRLGGGAGAVCSGQLSVRLAGGSGRCSGHLELLYNGTWGRVCADGTSPATAAAACRQLGCGDGGSLGAGAAPLPAPAWLAWVRCEDGARSLWRCPSAPWRLQPCGPGGDAHVVCAEDGAEGMLSPSPGSPTLTGVPRASTPRPATGPVPVPTVLCAVLGVLLCLALAALALQMYRAWAGPREPGRALDAVYEELDYTGMPEYQKVPSRPGWCTCSPTEGSETKLPYYTAEDVEESDPGAAPGSPALPEDGPPDGYDDAEAVPEESLGTGDTPEGVAHAGGSRPPPGGTGDPPEQPPGDTGYDDADVGTLGTLL
ncbi:scavenger receptor cysteine-rich type 1 protein M130-like [Neopsephotus bourkii]|uniref:scavenger receptor cysteine-rich type 1 protein M130-like n=1 Tax=Neopsephotus bourkii TaxID=309878 RepID=UPI002AA57412|nr:scavenger receptor cysteine-rich type 1 protein M130-like [Neopsephotus bourkii]